MFSNIVVGANGGEGGQDAAALAKVLADQGSRLVFAHVRLSDLVRSRAANADFDRSQSILASELVERERRVWGGQTDVCTIAAPSVGEGLERVAAEWEAGLIVVGACEHGPLGRVMVGDDAASVLHQAERTVAIAPHGYAGARHVISRVGAAFDGSAESEVALSLAVKLADELDAPLVTRCVVYPHVFVSGVGAGASYMEDPEDLRARTRAVLGKFAAGTEITIGPVEPMLAEFSGEVDLLVCGSRHNNVLRRVALGTTSGYLAHHSACPLLVAGPPAVARAGAVDQVAANAGSASD